MYLLSWSVKSILFSENNSVNTVEQFLLNYFLNAFERERRWIGHYWKNYLMELITRKMSSDEPEIIKKFILPLIVEYDFIEFSH